MTIILNRFQHGWAKVPVTLHKPHLVIGTRFISLGEEGVYVGGVMALRPAEKLSQKGTAKSLLGEDSNLGGFGQNDCTLELRRSRAEAWVRRTLQ